MSLAPTLPGRRRSMSLSSAADRRQSLVALLHQPGGFRRHALAVRQGRLDEFLGLYNNFAGENLSDSDGESSDEDSGDCNCIRSDSCTHNCNRNRSNNNIHNLNRSEIAHQLPRPAKNNTTASVMMILKSFIGTGCLFLPRAFSNGGMLFSVLALAAVSAVSLFAFLLLIRTRNKINGSFGDIGGILYGTPMRIAILTSIVVSQLGFVAAYTVFIAQNMHTFLLSVSHVDLSTAHLIVAQLAVFLPLSLYRNISKLAFTALIADACILVGLLYIFAYEGTIIARAGVADTVNFNPASFSLMIGTAVFAFEGIGLVIPLSEASAEPDKFPTLLCWCMAGITALFAACGISGYAAFGSSVQTAVISNLPTDSAPVQAIQFLYSLAILLSTPLQLFPAVRIMEAGLFKKSGRSNYKIKWQKNAFRFGIVILTSIVAWFGAADLDKFVSIIGSVACIPLGLIYPPLLHLKGVATTRREKTADILLILLGSFAAVFTSVQTINLIRTPVSS